MEHRGNKQNWKQQNLRRTATYSIIHSLKNNILTAKENLTIIGNLTIMFCLLSKGALP